MRVRTDDRRNAILEAATQIFRQVGYERASMAMIAKRVGGSKTTLYGYFPSKEELFWEAMIGAVREQHGENVLAVLETADPNIAAVLSRFGKAYLSLFMSHQVIAITRTAIAESGSNRALSALLYERGPKRVLDRIAAYMSRVKEQGALGDVDPHLAAVHLKGLLDAGAIEPLLFGVKPELKAGDAVRAAVDAFLRAYGIGAPA